MRTLVILATSLFVLATPLAAADEADPDCEANQPWIGYQSTLFVRQVYYNSAPGAAKEVNVCEGEHWDGQDTVQPGQSASCAGTVNPSAPFVGLCLGADPNGMNGDNPTNPLGLRVSGSPGTKEAYVGANIALVGRAVVYVSPDSTAIYLRDNTPGNVLATVISAARLTQGYPSENDCDQELYQRGAMSQPPQPLCGRDNTAVTIEYPTLV